MILVWTLAAALAADPTCEGAAAIAADTLAATEGDAVDPGPPEAIVPTAPLPPVTLPPIARPGPVQAVGDLAWVVHDGTLTALGPGPEVLGSLRVGDAREALASERHVLLLSQVPSPWDSHRHVRRATVVEAGDGTAPRLARTLDVDGWILDAAFVGDALWLVVSGDTGIGKRREPRESLRRAHPYDPAAPYDPRATREHAATALSSGLLRVRDGERDRTLLDCEDLHPREGDLPGGVIAVVRLPLDGGALSAEAVFGGRTAVSSTGDGIAVGTGGGRFAIFRPDGDGFHVQQGTVPGSIADLALAGDTLTVAWSDLPPVRCSIGIPCRPEPARGHGLSRIALSGTEPVEVLRAVGTGPRLGLQGAAFGEERAVFALGDPEGRSRARLASIDLRTGAQQERDTGRDITGVWRTSAGAVVVASGHGGSGRVLTSLGEPALVTADLDLEPLDWRGVAEHLAPMPVAARALAESPAGTALGGGSWLGILPRDGRWLVFGAEEAVVVHRRSGKVLARLPYGGASAP